MHSGTQSLEEQFGKFIQSADLVHSGDSILLAVSGGIDSMVMLNLFIAVRDCWRLNLSVVHVNHQLRGAESDKDEEFVRVTAQLLQLRFHSKRVDTLQYAHNRRLSKQEAARELRYQFFEEVREERNLTSVATAHQADDNAETVLMNVLRGAGVHGLSGIPLRRENGSIIRPLLFARRHEIEHYALERKIAFRTDSSNESMKYTRNYIRKTIIPSLNAEIQPDVVGSLNRLANIMRRLSKRISHEVDNRWNKIVQADSKEHPTLAIPCLASEPQFLREEIVVRFLQSVGCSVEFDRVQSILNLCSHPSGRSVQLSRSLAVYRDRDRLVCIELSAQEALYARVSLGEKYTFEEFQFSLSGPTPIPASFDADSRTEYVDADRLGERLILRSWRDGDAFIPLGMHTRKKLSDFFVDEKIPLFEKPTIPILESEGEIVWICGKRLDNRFKLTRRSRSAIKLHYIPLPSFH